jgi:hypothetical protein
MATIVTGCALPVMMPRQSNTDCVHCEVRADAEETSGHRAYNTAQHNQTAALRQMELTRGML